MRFAQGKLGEGSVAIGSEILRFAQDDRSEPCLTKKIRQARLLQEGGLVVSSRQERLYTGIRSYITRLHQLWAYLRSRVIQRKRTDHHLNPGVGSSYRGRSRHATSYHAGSSHRCDTALHN